MTKIEPFYMFNVLFLIVYYLKKYIKYSGTIYAHVQTVVFKYSIKNQMFNIAHLSGKRVLLLTLL